MTPEAETIFNDLTDHAMNAAMRVIDLAEIERRGDVAINVGINLAHVGCAFIVVLLAPDLLKTEGEDGVTREAGRLWRRVSTAIGKAKTDEQLTDSLQRVTRNFKPLDKNGRCIALDVSAEIAERAAQGRT